MVSNHRRRDIDLYRCAPSKSHAQHKENFGQAFIKKCAANFWHWSLRVTGELCWSRALSLFIVHKLCARADTYDQSHWEWLSCKTWLSHALYIISDQFNIRHRMRALTFAQSKVWLCEHTVWFMPIQHTRLWSSTTILLVNAFVFISLQSVYRARYRVHLASCVPLERNSCSVLYLYLFVCCITNDPINLLCSLYLDITLSIHEWTWPRDYLDIWKCSFLCSFIIIIDLNGIQQRTVLVSLCLQTDINFWCNN